MSYFGRNIKKIRTAKKISQSVMADLFNLKRGSIGAYEEGRAEAKIDTVIEIASYYKLSVDQLLCNELTFNQIYHISEINQRFEKAISLTNTDISIPLIKEKDRLEFIKKYNNQTYLQGLQIIKLPDSRPLSLAFELTNNDIATDSNNSRQGDIIVAEQFNLNELTEYSINSIFIILEDEKLHFVRIDGSRQIRFKTNQIKMLWRAYKLITNEFPIFSDLTSTLKNIESKLDSLLRK
jgi:transcriptional regulator with XRE-family HTH domain